MGVNVIVTTRDINFRKYKVINSLKSITNWEGVDYLIYNKAVEKIPDVLVALKSIVGKVKGLVYISDRMIHDEKGDGLYTYFQNNNAYIYTDVEEMLSDEETLDYVMDNLGEVGTELALPNESLIDMLGQQVAQLSNGPITQSKLETIDGMVKDLGNKLVIADNASKRMANVLVDIAESLGKLKSKEIASHSKILELSTQVEEMANKGTSMSISDYIEPYDVPPVTRNVVYVKEYGDVGYIASFLKYYICYLRDIKHLSFKLLILRPNLPIYDKLYSRDKGIYRLDTATLDTAKIENNRVFVTYEPSKLIFDTYFDKDKTQSVDGYIVLDMTQHNELLIRGHMVTMIGGFTSPSAYMLFQDKFLPTHAIYSIQGHAKGIWIPYYNGFEDVPLAYRESSYVKYCMRSFASRVPPYMALDSVLCVDNIIKQ